MENEEKRMLGDYEVRQSIHIGKKEVVFGVNEADKYPFMVCFCTYDNPFSAAWATEAVGTDDYLEAMQIFTDRVQAQIEVVKEEQSRFDFDMTPFTTEDCIPDNRNESIVGKVVVSMQSLTAMNISTLPISLYWWTADTVQLAAEVRRCLVLALQTVNEPDGKGTMCLVLSSQRKCQIGQRKPLLKSRNRKKQRSLTTRRNDKWL